MFQRLESGETKTTPRMREDPTCQIVLEGPVYKNHLQHPRRRNFYSSVHGRATRRNWVWQAPWTRVLLQTIDNVGSLYDM